MELLDNLNGRHLHELLIKVGKPLLESQSIGIGIHLSPSVYPDTDDEKEFSCCTFRLRFINKYKDWTGLQGNGNTEKSKRAAQRASTKKDSSFDFRGFIGPLALQYKTGTAG